MSMISFFPTLTQIMLNSVYFDLDMTCDDENELRELEREHVTWLKSIQQTAVDLPPIGKTPTIGDPEPDSDDEGGNDDSEDSDTHDEEEEDEMEVIDGNQAANTTAVTSTMDTSTYTSSPEFFSGAGRSH